MRSIKIIIVITIIIVIAATPTLALEDIGYSRIHPASPLYFLKGVRENLELHFAQTDRVRELRQLEFATRRLRETRALIPINQDLIQPTLERYIAYLNSLTDKHQPNDEFAQVIENNLAIHLEILQQIYAKISNLRAKMAIRSAMNRIIHRADTATEAKKQICNFFIKEASSAALNETEKTVLLERGQKCLEMWI